MSIVINRNNLPFTFTRISLCILMGKLCHFQPKLVLPKINLVSTGFILTILPVSFIWKRPRTIPSHLVISSTSGQPSFPPSTIHPNWTRLAGRPMSMANPTMETSTRYPCKPIHSSPWSITAPRLSPTQPITGTASNRRPSHDMHQPRHRSGIPLGEGGWPLGVTLSRSEGSRALGHEMLRGVYTERSERAQHDSMVMHAASRGCHPEPQRRVSRVGPRDA